VNGPAATVALTATPDVVQADGSSVSVLRAVVRDANGNTVTSGVVNWSTSLGSLASSTSTINQSGVAMVGLTSTTSGAATVRATVGSASDTAAVTFTAGAASTVAVTASPSSIVANGTSTSTLTATVRDANGNGVPGFAVAWTTTNGSLATSSTTTDANGVAMVVLTSSTTAGTANITAGAPGVTGNSSVTFIPPTPVLQALSVSGDNHYEQCGSQQVSAARVSWTFRDTDASTVYTVTGAGEHAITSAGITSAYITSNGRTSGTLLPNVGSAQNGRNPHPGQVTACNGSQCTTANFT
jgi:adhesin/invasin